MEAAPVPRVEGELRVRVPAHGVGYLSAPDGIVTARTASRFGKQAERAQRVRSARSTELGRRIVDDASRLGLDNLQRREKAHRRLTQGDGKLAEQWLGQLATALREDEQLRRGLAASLARGKHRASWQTLTVLSSLPLFSVFGRQNLRHQVTLLVLLLVWLFGDEVTDLLSNSKPGVAEADRAPWWGYLAPLANGVAAWWLLHEQQHEPLISGVAHGFVRKRAERRRVPRASLSQTLSAARALVAPCLADAPARRKLSRVTEEYVCRVDLTEHVAPGFRLDVVAAGALPVLVSVGKVDWHPEALSRAPRVESIEGSVELGVLEMRLRVSARRVVGRAAALVNAAEAAWVVQVVTVSLF